MMENTYWHKQSTKEPLFTDLLWSRPETKQTAGKLLIIGGNINGFAAVGQAYTASQKAGIGSARIILPDSLRKTVSRLMPESTFAASTPSGSFSQQALAELLENAAWSDGVLLAGDLAHNSETAIVLEKLANKYSEQLTITKDAMDYFTAAPNAIAKRPDTTLVLTMAQLQRLAKSLKFEIAFTFDINLLNLVDSLRELTNRFAFNIVIKHLDTIIVAVKGQLSSTKTNLSDEDSWRVPIAAGAAVWWLQNPTKPFEAISTSLLPV